MVNSNVNIADSNAVRQQIQPPGQNQSMSLETAELFPFQIIDIKNILLVRLTELDFRRASFIHQIARSTDNINYLLSLNEFASLAKNIPVVPCSRFIFHISHVGSTLLSKVLGQPEHVLSLREPLLLRWLAELRNNLDKPESLVSTTQFDDYFASCLVYLSRKFRPVNEVVIKATSFTNVLADRILSQPHLPSAVFVYSSFPTFLATILKTPASISTIYGLAPSRLARLHRILNADTWRLYELSVGEILAMSWVSEMLTLELAERGHEAQITWLDFDKFLKSDVQTQLRMFDHLNIRISSDDVSRIESNGVMQTYSKDPSKSYDRLDRAKDIDLVLNREAIAVAQGKTWLKNASAMYPVIADLSERGQW